MQIASIDVGTNTALLYVAEISEEKCSIKTIANEYQLPRLGKGIGTTGLISVEKKQELLKVLLNFKRIADLYHCSEIVAGGTYPFRAAANAQEVISFIKANTGISITVLEPELEAEFAFLGATYLSKANEKPMVIDIGGGSTELSYGSSKILLYKKSIPIGAVNLTERYFSSVAEQQENLMEVRTNLQKQLREAFRNDMEITKTVGIAGTPTTLAAIKAGLLSFDEALLDGSELTKDELESFIEELSTLSPSEALKKYGPLLKGREDVLLAGTVILCEVLNFLHQKKVTVSTNGLRHGLLFNYCFKTFGKYFELKY